VIAGGGAARPAGPSATAREYGGETARVSFRVHIFTFSERYSSGPARRDPGNLLSKMRVCV